MKNECADLYLMASYGIVSTLNNNNNNKKMNAQGAESLFDGVKVTERKWDKKMRDEMIEGGKSDADVRWYCTAIYRFI